MKINKRYLKKIITEETQKIFKERADDPSIPDPTSKSSQAALKRMQQPGAEEMPVLEMVEKQLREGNPVPALDYLIEPDSAGRPARADFKTKILTPLVNKTHKWFIAMTKNKEDPELGLMSYKDSGAYKISKYFGSGHSKDMDTALGKKKKKNYWTKYDQEQYRTILKMLKNREWWEAVYAQFGNVANRNGNLEDVLPGMIGKASDKMEGNMAQHFPNSAWAFLRNPYGSFSQIQSLVKKHMTEVLKPLLQERVRQLVRKKDPPKPQAQAQKPSTDLKKTRADAESGMAEMESVLKKKFIRAKRIQPRAIRKIPNVSIRTWADVKRYMIDTDIPEFKGLGRDAVYDRNTFNAIYKFQQRAFPGKAKEHDGIVGGRTWAKIAALMPDED